jgi:hypothetical protein
MKTLLYWQNYLCVPYSSHKKAATLFLDSIKWRLFHTQKKGVSIETWTESVHAYTTYIKFNLYQLHGSYGYLPKSQPKRYPSNVIITLSYCCYPYNKFWPGNQIISCCIFPTVQVPSLYLLHFQAQCINFGLYLPTRWQHTVPEHLDSKFLFFPCNSNIYNTLFTSTLFLVLLFFNLLLWFCFSLTYWQTDCLITLHSK